MSARNTMPRLISPNVGSDDRRPRASGGEIVSRAERPYFFSVFSRPASNSRFSAISSATMLFELGGRQRHQVGAEFREAVFCFRHCERRNRRCVNFLHQVRRHVLRPEQADPGAHAHLEATLSDGRYVREQRRALLGGRRNRDQQIVVHEGAAGSERSDHEIDAACGGVSNRFRCTPIGHVSHLDVCGCTHALDLEMRGAGDTARTEHHFARCLAGFLDQFVDTADTFLRRHPDHRRQIGQRDDRGEILFSVVRQGRLHRGQGGDRG